MLVRILVPDDWKALLPCVCVCVPGESKEFLFNAAWLVQFLFDFVGDHKSVVAGVAQEWVLVYEVSQRLEDDLVLVVPMMLIVGIALDEGYLAVLVIHLVDVASFFHHPQAARDDHVDDASDEVDSSLGGLPRLRPVSVNCFFTHSKTPGSVWL